MTTPIIHPINEKKPDASRAAWLNKMQTMLELYARYGMYQNESQLQEAFRLRDEIIASLPPEVTPEQGKGRKHGLPLPPDCTHQPGAINPDPLLKDPATGRTFRMSDPPASGPSPAALAAAKEIAENIVPGGFSSQSHLSIAAIIDRKFPREEDGAILDIIEDVWSRGNSAEWVALCMKAAGQGFRAALQDSREGK